jgi:hypothetical protein
MTMGEILTIEQVPAELKKFWIDEAERNARSLSEEVVGLLEETRLRRQPLPPKKKDIVAIRAAARRLQSLVAGREAEFDDKLLYDDDGMPK